MGPMVCEEMKKVNKQCLLDTPRTVRVSEKTWQVRVQTSRPYASVTFATVVVRFSLLRFSLRFFRHRRRQ